MERKMKMLCKDRADQIREVVLDGGPVSLAQFVAVARHGANDDLIYQRVEEMARIMDSGKLLDLCEKRMGEFPV